MSISLRRPDYRKYHWKRGEKAGTAVLCAGAVGLLAYFFYRSPLAVAPLSLVGVLLFCRIAKEKGRQGREELAAQFRECILAVSTSLQAGYSAENAFVECRQDMALMYGESGAIVREMDIIRRGMTINIPLEELLTDMADRSGCDEIEQFAQIFSIAKRSGGNMAEIIGNSADQIGRRIRLKQELRALLSGRRMELGIMKAMPFGILIYIDMGNPGYFDPLYHNAIGIIVMTLSLAVYLGAFMLGERIMDGLMGESPWHKGRRIRHIEKSHGGPEGG